MNKRNDFRVKTIGVTCKLNQTYNNAIAEINNISGSGMMFTSNANDFNDQFFVEFQLEEKEFFKLVKIIHRVQLASGKSKYQVVFVNQTESEREMLHSVLTAYAAKLQA
jgi:hypothetical protein